MMNLLGSGKPSGAERCGEKGSALVELALSLPLLCLMLLGAVEFARIVYASIEVTNAAHAAVMYAASSVAASTDLAGISNAAATDSQNLFGGNAVSVTSVQPVCTCSNTAITGIAPSGCTDNTTCVSNNGAMIKTVTVQTQANYSPLISIPGGALTFALNGQSSQVVTNQ